MALALVKLTKERGNQTYSFLDYISAEVAELDVEIQGEEHGYKEWSKINIIKIINKYREFSEIQLVGLP